MEQRSHRRRVFMTAGLTASAAVLAMSVQAAAQAGDERPGPSYGDTPVGAAEPDQDGPEDDGPSSLP